MVSALSPIVFRRMQTRASVVLRTCMLAWIVIISLLSDAIGNEIGSDRNYPIVLSVRGDVADNLRCLIILAHFVTQHLVPVDNGFELTFYREHSSGTLSESTSGSGMLVENILCGDKDDWQNTTADIPLVLLRSSQSNRFVAHCRIESRLRCDVRAKVFERQVTLQSSIF